LWLEVGFGGGPTRLLHRELGRLGQMGH
jgi:hypothetical protein